MVGGHWTACGSSVVVLNDRTPEAGQRRCMDVWSLEHTWGRCRRFLVQMIFVN